MKKLLLLLFTASVCLYGCKKSETGPDKEDPSIAESRPYKIQLSSDWLSIPTTEALIKSDNIAEINLTTKVTNKNGGVLNTECKLTLNGKDYNSKSFKTLIPGDYIFIASIGDLKSNEYTITAKDLAERYASIEGSSINKINSVGLVTVGIRFKNISDKKLKYINFTVSCYNRVNDLIREEIGGSSSISCRATGFFDQGQSGSSAWEIGYFTGVTSIKVKLYSVTFEDGKIIYAS